MTDLATRPTDLRPAPRPPRTPRPATPPPAAPPPTGRLPSRPAGVPLAPAPASRLRPSDLALAATALAACTVGLWSRHGGLADLLAGGTATWSALGRLGGLVASVAGLVGLVLVARPRSLERLLGQDRLLRWHRPVGITMAVALAVHIAAEVGAASAALGLAGAVADLTGGQPYLAQATVAAGLVLVVTLTSLRWIRRKMAYETWYFVHLTAYVALALAFTHTIVLGTDLATDPVAFWAWVALHVAVVALLVVSRFGRLVLAWLRPLRVAGVEHHGPGIATLRLRGKPLATMRVSPGQWFLLRPLRSRLWWQAHPYSLSAAPSTDGLAFTIKDRGDASAATLALTPGTRVVVEGPYGVCTPPAFAGRKVLLVAGGVGIGPARSLLEGLSPAAEPVVLYRAHSPEEVVDLPGLRRLAAERNGRVLTLVGPTATLAVRDPFRAEVLCSAVPDLPERAVALFGPDRLLHACRAGLRAAGVAHEDVHVEASWW